MSFRAFALPIVLFTSVAARAAQCDYNSESSFLSRVVAIESGNGAVYRPGKDGAGEAGTPTPLELHSKEVVLTFDQGPHRDYTQYILDILDHHCAKATFFFGGVAALAAPDAVRDAAQRGHTLAAGQWQPPARGAAIPPAEINASVEKAFTAVSKASGGQAAPFFRTALPANSAISSYLKERGVSLWFADLDAGDTEPGLTASQLANGTLLKIREMGQGVIAFHDTKKVTVDALDSVLTGLKLSGFKVVHIVPATSFAPQDGEAAASAVETPVPAPSSASRELLDLAKRAALQSDGREKDVRSRDARGEIREGRGRRALLQQRIRQRDKEELAFLRALEKRRALHNEKEERQPRRVQDDRRPESSERAAWKAHREIFQRRARQREQAELEARRAALTHRAAMAQRIARRRELSEAETRRAGRARAVAE